MLAGDRKGALREGGPIVVADESGLKGRPHRCRTWAPKGQTPILQLNFNWNLFSAIAGLTIRNSYFRRIPGTIKAPLVVECFTHLLGHIRGKVVLVWDGLPAHGSRLVKAFIAMQGDRLRRVSLHCRPNGA